MDPQLELSRHKRNSSASSLSYYSQYPLDEEPVTIQSHLDHYDTSTSKSDTNELFHRQDDHHPNVAQPSHRYGWGDGLTLMLFCMLLLVPLTTLVSFGLAVAFVTAGSWILNYASSLHAAYESTVITLAFAKLLACGAAIADGAVFLLALAVAWYAAQCGAPRTAVFWAVEVIGTIMAGAFAAAIGVVVLPHRMGVGLTATRALKAGPLGLAVLGVPIVLISGMLYMCLQRKQVLV
ncbi:hypothetical protein C8Q74DRAFT_594018 [Fomes fomentarius]|nr:hypothetical protein C8Q74DRAFT_594018 [Fomes fomentarius]